MVGDVSPTEVPSSLRFQDIDVEIVQRASYEEAFEFVRHQKFSCLLVCDHAQSIEALQLVMEARHQRPLSPRFLAARDTNEKWIREGINKAQIFQFLKMPMSAEDLIKAFQKALIKHDIFISRSLLLREASHQNKQLEALTASLEEIVDERTRHIESSNKEQTEKLSRERQLIRFIKDMATQTSFEDILHILRREIRRFHKLGDPILAYRLDGVKTYFLSFQSGNFTQTETHKSFPFPHELEPNSPEIMQPFANHFGRPFAKTIILPLELKLIRHLNVEKVEAIICIENSLSKKEMISFLEYISDRLQPLSMVLDRVLLENQLSVYSYRWEKTFDGMRDPIAIVDMDYQVVRSNRKFSSKLINQKCYQSFAHRETPCEGCPVPKALAAGTSQSGQIEVNNRIYQVHSYPIQLDHGGRATNVVNQYVDITQARELYLRMLQTEKMGAIGMLAGNIAHELNNPLTGLRSLAQVLMAEAKDETLKADLLEIEKAATRSQRIIKNLLDFSKGENQPTEDTSIDEVVEKTLPMLKSAMRNHRINIQLKTSQYLVHAEPNLLQQVVFNIINNACQAMKEAGQLSVRTYTKGPSVFLEIQDTGPGIPEAVGAKIFEPFFTTKKEGQGTGLGLSMSKSVIEKFGGHIQFQSVNPHGTCFTIELPLSGRGQK